MQIGDKIYYVKPIPFSGKTEFIDENGNKWARMHPYPKKYKVFELKLKTIVRTSFEGEPVTEKTLEKFPTEYMQDYLDRWFFESDDGKAYGILDETDYNRLVSLGKVDMYFLNKNEAETYAMEMNKYDC